jgi:integrase
MARGFTEIAIRNLKPGPVRYEMPDPAARGLYCIVQPSGHKSFAVRFRYEGKPKKLSLGSISLSAARKAAAHALHEVREGRDPCEAKSHAKQERRTSQANTFQKVALQFLKLETGMQEDGDQVTFSGTMRTAGRYLRDLNRLVFPTLGDRPITEIKRSEIVTLLDQIQIGNGPVMADRILAAIRAIMNWHTSRSDDFKSPIVRGMARTKSKERARQRILSDDELRKVWTAGNKAEGSFPALVKFLLLTGARRGEATGMTWAELKDGDWELPAVRNKTGLNLVRPLSKAALGVIESQRREGSRYVFTATTGLPIVAFTKRKAEFDKASSTSGWRLHDLRRTARSLMARAGVNSEHAERCLGHTIGGVEGIYNRHHYQSEMKRAYDALAALIELIVRPPEDNVTPLRKKKPA